MVEEANLEGKIVFKCMKCGFLYRNKRKAEECERWCNTYDTCNLVIIKDSIKLNKMQRQR